MLTPDGGSCHPMLEAQRPITYLYFNRATELGESFHHASLYTMYFFMEHP